MGTVGLAVTGSALLVVAADPAKLSTPVPVIYSSDLLHPHEDPDDHFDLACLFAMPEADLRAVVLDCGHLQVQRPGFKPVWQLNWLAGRHVPSAVGLRDKLKTPEDPGLDQPAEHQNGVNLILQALQDSREKVAIIFVGSARDVAAAYNRAPDLFSSRVRSIHGFIGEASDPGLTEYNVGLDPKAFVRLMRADVPFHWIPCFDGGLWQNRGHASFWQITQGQVLERAPEPLLQYFLYMLRKETGDPIAFLTRPVAAADRRWLMDGKRNLWAAAILGLAVGRQVPVGGPDIAGFSPVEVAVNDQGLIHPGAAGARSVQRFEIRNLARFAEVVTAATADILARFPVVRR